MLAATRAVLISVWSLDDDLLRGCTLDHLTGGRIFGAQAVCPESDLANGGSIDLPHDYYAFWRGPTQYHFRGSRRRGLAEPRPKYASCQVRTFMLSSSILAMTHRTPKCMRIASRLMEPSAPRYILIIDSDRSLARNIDSKSAASGFDCCLRAARR